MNSAVHMKSAFMGVSEKLLACNRSWHCYHTPEEICPWKPPAELFGPKELFITYAHEQTTDEDNLNPMVASTSSSSKLSRRYSSESLVSFSIPDLTNEDDFSALTNAKSLDEFIESLDKFSLPYMDARLKPFGFVPYDYPGPAYLHRLESVKVPISDKIAEQESEQFNNLLIIDHLVDKLAHINAGIKYPMCLKIKYDAVVQNKVQSGAKRSLFGAGIGPFLSMLFNRLSNMCSNTFFTNLLLTDIIRHLAMFPHPILADIMLNNEGSARFHSKSLFQVLSDLKLTLIGQLHSMSDAPSLLESVYGYITDPESHPELQPHKQDQHMWRENSVPKNIKSECQLDKYARSSSSVRAVERNQNVTLNEALENFQNSARGSRFEITSPIGPQRSRRTPSLTSQFQSLFSRRKSSITSPAFNKFLDPLSPKPPDRDSNPVTCVSPQGEETHLPVNTEHASAICGNKNRNCVFALFVFVEFCQEISAICCEHAVIASRTEKI